MHVARDSRFGGNSERSSAPAPLLTTAKGKPFGLPHAVLAATPSSNIPSQAIFLKTISTPAAFKGQRETVPHSAKGELT